MKKKLTIIILLIAVKFCFSQQQEYWFLNNQTVDVTNNQTVPNTFGNNTDPESVTNAIYDQNGDAVLYVSNYAVYSPSGLIGYITPQNAACVNKGNEVEIVPVPQSPCKYYIVFNAYVAGPNPNCPCCFPPIHAFYALVDVSANNGSGSIVNIQELTPNATGERCNIAIAKENNNKRNLYVTTSSNISKFEISSNGITFQNNIYSDILSAQGELDLSHQEDKLAINTNNGLKIIHLNTNGDLDNFSGNQGNGVSEYGIVSSFIPGTEFSVNGDYLYYSDDNDIYQLELVSGSNTTFSTVTSDYSHSQLELGFDLNIYAVSNNNELGQILAINTNTPSFNPNYLSVQAGLTDGSYNIKTLPDQVDGADYSTFFQDCCINNDIVINLPSTISVCDGTFEEICGPLAPNGATYTYQWYSTQYNPFPTSVLEGEEMCFTPSQIGIHTLIVTDENGCTARHTIKIIEGLPQPDLGVIDCEQVPIGTINILNQGFDNPDYTITWYHNNQVVQVGGETLMMSIAQGEITVTISVDGCEPVSDTTEIYCCPEDLEIIMNCETGKLEVQNIPNNITINTMFWDFDFQTFPNSNSTTFQPTQEGVYSFGIIFTFPNGEECHHFIHYDYKEDYCCEITGSQAVASLSNVTNYYNVPHTPYGPMEIPALCERVTLDGSLSTCEDAYYISVAAFDPVSWSNDPTVTPNPIYQGWTQGQAPNNIELTQSPFNLVFDNQTFYMIQFAVGPDWDAEYILFWYNCDVKRKMVITPNPTQGEFTVSMTNNKKEGSVEVLDLSGNSILKNSVDGEKPTSLNITKERPGVYFVRIYIEGEVYTKKIIKN